jgi:AraC-like DNA-binding protein
MKSELYIPASAYLKNVIRSIWEVNDLSHGKNETIIPKGVVEIIFDLSGSAPVNSDINGKHLQLAKCFINGFNTSPVRLYIPAHHFFFGVQFHPVAIRHLFGIPAGEFTNLAVDLTLLNQSFNSLWHQLAEAQAFAERVQIICSWVQQKIIDTDPRELLLNSFLEKNQVHFATLNELSKTLCYSPRHLSRKINDLTGMNTEQMLRYKKYLHAVQLIHHTNLPLTAIAYETNFTDQSHFIKSFKAFAQITPGEYRQTRSHIPGHILNNGR